MNIIKEITTVQNYYKSRYGLELNKKQLDLVKTKDKHYKDTFDRATGCTSACIIKAIEFAINNQNSNVAVFTFAKYASTFQFNVAHNFLSNDKLSRFVYRKVPPMNYIELINGSRLSFISGKNLESKGCGQRMDCAIIDGEKYISNKVLNCINHMTIESNGQVISIDQTDVLN